MAFTKDQWTRPAKQPDGTVKRVRNEARWGRGKRWLAVWLDPNGAERSKAFDTKTAATKYAAAMETDRERGDYFDPEGGKAKLAEVAAHWLASRDVDPSTEIHYETKWRLHVGPAFGNRQLRSIRPSEIGSWLTRVKTAYGPSTARSAFLVLNGCLELAVADGLIKKNPAQSKLVTRPATSRSKVHVWTPDLVDRIIDVHPDEYRLIPILGAACGLRQGEIFGLALEDFDFEEQVIRVRRQVKKLGKHFVFALPKNDLEREVPLAAWPAARVHEYVERHAPEPYSLPWERPDNEPVTANLLFRWLDGGHMKARNYDEVVWKPALAAAGVIPPAVRDARGRRHFKTDRTTGLHALRHHYASVSLADGVNIKELAEYLGHGDPGFTLALYTHLLPSSHDRARRAIDARFERLSAA
ncbi:hypothetical protein BWI15_01245 [Kribbella sp. ALI-6-A]|uniref:tyrosine-type recombinase/integrase n=1 Tax=Kribbella sp. ALI-6-A TaxID=1933817 RepID=UPI00097C56F6|nr:site-specific integrase [Kribbella sp. ALI-6-A]ONI78525.1 hypothetical protein BWI15_01245 [Kribbella sp. ALI-6-A]